MVTESGEPLNISNFQSVIDTFVNNPRDRQRLIRRMKKFGLTVKLVQKETPNQRLPPEGESTAGFEQADGLSPPKDEAWRAGVGEL